tara:strand:- start:3294 stop:3494 length:201 start_codon:yes stop_codon:yes gene_type:complete
MEKLYKMNYKLWLIVLLLLLACAPKKEVRVPEQTPVEFIRYEEIDFPDDEELEDLPEAGEETEDEE